jgi:hypothetical protein
MSGFIDFAEVREPCSIAEHRQTAADIIRSVFKKMKDK